MFQKLEAQNDEWNRKYNFIEENSVGFLMDYKNGLAFFGWKFSDDNVKFYKCEQSVFEKRFKLLQDQVEHELDPYENINFLRYPIDL
jgi:hypothetical protein